MKWMLVRVFTQWIPYRYQKYWAKEFLIFFLQTISTRWWFLINCGVIDVGKVISTVELILNHVIDAPIYE